MKGFLAGIMATLLIACSAQKIYIGSRETQDASPDRPEGAIPDATSPSCESGSQLPIVGVWDGYIENTTFLSGSSALRVVVSHANERFACGSVMLGDRSPPPAPDPDLPYPPTLDDDHRGNGSPSWTLVEGFAMPFVDAPIVDHSLYLELDWLRFWSSWCPLQQPEHDGVIYVYDAGAVEHYACATNVRVVYESTWPFSATCFQGERPYSCGKAWVCGFCTCDAQGCSIQHIVGIEPLGMSLTFGTETSGSVADTFPRPLHLERTPEDG